MPAAITDKFADTYNAANPNVARVTSTRSAAGSSLSCDNLSGWPTGTVVHFSTYQLNTSNQVVAGTQIDWTGIVSGSTIGSLTRITGATDNGSAVGDVVEMNPTAKWASNLVNGILVSHNQDGTHKTNMTLTTNAATLTSPKVITSINDTNNNELIAVTATASAVNEITVTNAATGTAPSISATGGDSAVNLNLRGKGLAKTVTIGAGAATIFPYDFVLSGCVWTADAAGSTRLASMTSGVVVINGNPVTVAAVTGRTFTASKDVYVDVLDNGDGTGLLVYTDNTTNAASPALASNSVRLAIIVVGASSIATAASVNQGQEDRVLPIASSVPYAVTDSLGNLICPRDPQRRIIGYRQITSTATQSSTSATQITGLSVPVIVPTGRKVLISAGCGDTAPSGGYTTTKFSVWDGTVGSGTQIFELLNSASTTAGSEIGIYGSVPVTPSSSSKTYNGGLRSSGAASANLFATSTNPAYIRVELV